MFIFLALAVIGIVLVGVSAFLGHDFDAHPELEVGGIGFFSLRALSIFIMTFGTHTPLTCSDLRQTPPVQSAFS